MPFHPRIHLHLRNLLHVKVLCGTHFADAAVRLPSSVLELICKPRLLLVAGPALEQAIDFGEAREIWIGDGEVRSRCAVAVRAQEKQAAPRRVVPLSVVCVAGGVARHGEERRVLAESVQVVVVVGAVAKDQAAGARHLAVCADDDVVLCWG